MTAPAWLARAPVPSLGVVVTTLRDAALAYAVEGA